MRAKKYAIGIALGAAGLVMPLCAYADNTTVVTDALKITVDETCSFTTDNSASVDSYDNAATTIYTATMSNGETHTFGTGDSAVVRRINVVCNNFSGYQVLAMPSDLMPSAPDNNELISYTTSPLSNYTNNIHGYWHATVTSISTEAASGAQGFHIAQYENGYTPIAYDDIATAGDTFEVTYGVYVGAATPADTYTGTISYNLVTGYSAASVETNTVTWIATDATVYPATSVVPANRSILAPVPSKAGNDFDGWFDAATGGSLVVNGGELYTPTSTITLYAHWTERPVSMQTMNASYCAHMDTDRVISLPDTRDHNTYKVIKRSDGKCWMMENLRLEKTNSYTTLSSTDSNLPAGTTFELPDSQTRGIDTWGPSTDIEAVNTANVYSNGAASITDGDGHTQFIGNYYNWHTATAGTGTYATTSGNAAGSICPYGWRLPSSAEMSAMATAYSTDFTAMPMSLVLSGYYGAGVFNQEDSGFLWSSTAKDNTDAYYMHYDDNSILTGNNSKFYGYSVRCVF